MADPYSLTGNMAERPWAGGFGAGRYTDSPASGGGFVSNNTEEAFGPLARFVSGNKYDTN